MIFEETRLRGAYLIRGDRREDERGFFETTFLAAEFVARGLDARVAQLASSFNRKKGTLRGLHYQAPPDEQAKLVRCLRGRAYDVLVDLRTGSLTCGSWFATELDSSTATLLYAPPGVAHGFMTMEDETEILYQLSTPRVAASERGVRWDDPYFGVEWPLKPSVVSGRDQRLALWMPN
jgi:dTDP-4-dehydrorhamnose 3,5-epimerase